MAYIDFNTFASVDLRIGIVESVEDHPNADRLYVVKINEGGEQERTVCAGLKDYYSKEELIGQHGGLRRQSRASKTEGRNVRGDVARG